jgi:hypothetical protein
LLACSLNAASCWLIIAISFVFCCSAKYFPLC